MTRIDDIAKVLGCTGSNVCYLLRKGRIKGTRTPARWQVSDEAVQEYLKEPTPVHPRKLHLHKGQRFGYWTVLSAKIVRTKSGGLAALCQCICGTTRYVLVESLFSGRSKSCGCRRAEGQNQNQLEGRDKGRVIMNQIHQEGLAARYINKKVNRNSKTGHTGVCWREKEHKYYAYIMVDRKQISLGLHDKLADAIAARKAAEERYFRSKQEKVDTIKRNARK